MNKEQKQLKMFWYAVLVMVAFSVILSIFIRIFPGYFFMERYVVLTGSIIGVVFYVFLSIYKSE